jgi:hypothetical protein
MAEKQAWPMDMQDMSSAGLMAKHSQQFASRNSGNEFLVGQLPA